MTVRNIAKNTLVSAISQVIISTLGFFSLIYIARYLGEAEFGKYSFALTFVGFFSILANIGSNNYIIREVSRNKEQTSRYLTSISVIKLILSVPTFASIILAINILDYSHDTKFAVYLFGIYMILTSFSETFSSIFQAHERMEYNAVVTVIEKSMLIILILFILSSGYGLIELAYAYILAGIVAVTLNFSIYLLRISWPKLTIDISLWKSIVIGSVPFGLNAIFGTIFFQIDTIMLSVLINDAAVGIYNAAYNPLLALSIIPGVFISAIYPVMSRYFASSKKSLEIIINLSFKYIAILGFAIAVGSFVLAEQIISFFYIDKFSSSIVAFQILAFFIPLRFVNNVNGTLLTSINRQGIRTAGVAFCALFNIVLNAIMIPSLSYIGACIATVLSEMILYFVFNYFINKEYKKLELHKYFIKPFIASLIMGGFVFSLKNENLFLLIILGACIYFLVLYVIRTFTKEDEDIFKQLISGGWKHK